MKTTRSRRWTGAGALLGLALLAAACGGGDDKKVAVKAADYTFKGLPKSAKTDTVFTLTNESTKELHEMVTIRIPDSEKRPVSELIKLPESELDKIFGGEPAMVLLAPPGGAPEIKAVGDGTIKEKGRYVVFCAIPTGADPQAYLAASQNSSGPPQVAGGPPHFVNGMFAELTVK